MKHVGIVSYLGTRSLIGIHEVFREQRLKSSVVKIYGGSGNDTLLGKSGDDTLYGDEATLVSTIANGGDILDGGARNDMLYGGGDNDTYIFGLGYGQDIISDDQMSYYNRTYYQLNAGYDTISLLEGIPPEDVSLRRDGMHLILSILNTSDTLTVQNFFSQLNDGAYYSAMEEIRRGCNARGSDGSQRHRQPQQPGPG